MSWQNCDSHHDACTLRQVNTAHYSPYLGLQAELACRSTMRIQAVTLHILLLGAVSFGQQIGQQFLLCVCSCSCYMLACLWPLQQQSLLYESKHDTHLLSAQRCKDQNKQMRPQISLTPIQPRSPMKSPPQSQPHSITRTQATTAHFHRSYRSSHTAASTQISDQGMT